MTALTVLVLAFAPGVFWLWYFYKKDKLEPEPKHLIVKTYFWGMGAIIPSFLLEIPFQGFVLAVIAAPAIEELAKYTVVRRTIYKNAEFDEPMDGILYAAAAALGFASAENLLYLARANLSPQEMLGSPEPVSAADAVLTVFIVRALLSVPGHVIFSTMWGYALGWSKFIEPERKKALIRNGILLAIFLHAIFNFLVSVVPLFSMAMLIFIVASWRAAHGKIEAALAKSPFSSNPPEKGK